MKRSPKSPRSTRRPDRRAWLVVLGLALTAGAPTARACGPYFPNRYIDAGAEQLLAAPEAFFADEVMRLLPPGTPRVAEREYQGWGFDPRAAAAERTARADLDELGAALLAAGGADGEVAALTEAYGRARASNAEAPDGTPAEFALYLRGAQAWKRGRVEAARTAWHEVLALPESGRRHRAVWAAYMLGRSHLVLPGDKAETDGAIREAEKALRWFARTEELAAGGAADALGLAGEAKGWRARLLAARGDRPAAVGLYLERLAEGDDTAVQSLRRVAREIVANAYGEDRAACVRDLDTRSVVVAFLLARAGPVHDRSDSYQWEERARDWALSIHEAGGREVRGADRLAWLAYEGGLFGLAADWLKIAPARSAEADWLHSKLALRSGDAAAGARRLERALREDGLQGAHRSLAWAELARARLALDQPAQALDAFLQGDHFEDAAFVAERLLSVDELAQAVDAAAARTPDPEAREIEGIDGDNDWARLLLARRLVRENRGERASPYLPEAQRETLAAYLTDVRLGFDSSCPAAERAEALWRAARLLRRHGLQLAGTALEPDWAEWGGAFELDPVARRRLGVPLLEGGVFAPTPDEQARIRKNPAPEKRFHYRYLAAELAWWAASLMPDGEEATARVLVEAGGWLKARDPKAAEPFYQALVLRCGDTAPGREAKLRRWFPRETDNARQP